MTQPQDEIRAQLADLDEQLARMRGDLSALTGQLGGNADGAQDDADTGAAMNNAMETDALIAILEQRRETLLGKLDDAG